MNSLAGGRVLVVEDEYLIAMDLCYTLDKEGATVVGPIPSLDDALLLRWGRWARRAKLGAWAIDEGSAGLDNSVIPWLKQRDVAVIAWETPGYVPQPAGDLPRLALHNFALTMLGIMLIDRADLDALSDSAVLDTGLGGLGNACRFAQAGMNLGNDELDRWFNAGALHRAP